MNESGPGQAAADSTSADAAQQTAEQAEGAPRDAPAPPRRFWDTVLADARLAAAYRGEPHEFGATLSGVVQVLRLMLNTDAFLALVAYRAKARLQALGIPVLPWIAHRIAMISAQVSIADEVTVHPGVYIPNGQVVIFGVAEISPFVTIFPWVTIGPVAGGTAGPTIGPRARIGTGAKVMGDIDIGADARVGVNAVVLDDVPADTTVVGMPAAPVTE